MLFDTLPVAVDLDQPVVAFSFVFDLDQQCNAVRALICPAAEAPIRIPS